MTDLTLVQNSSIADTMVKCSEMLVGVESIHERADTQEIIDITLDAIQENFWLIPKVTLNAEGEPVLLEEPIDAIPDFLKEIWNAFTNEEN